MARRYLVGLIAASLAVLISGCGDSNASDDPDSPLVIGVVYDGSGPNSAFSKLTVDMVQFAVSQINEGSDLIPGEILGDGEGILGRTVEVRLADDGGDPNKAVSATRELIGDGAAAVLLGSSSASAIQARVACEQEGVLCISPSNVSADIVAPPNASHVFSVSATVPMTAEAYIQAFQTSGYETIGYTSDDSPTGSATKDGYKALFEAAGFETVADEVIPIGASDVSAQLSKVESADPDVMFDASPDAQVSGLIFRTSQELMPDTPRWTFNGVTQTTAAWEIAGSGLEGVYSAAQITKDNPYTAALDEAFNSDGELLGPEAMAWDATLLVKYAVEQAESTDGSDLVAQIESTTDFPASHGPAGYTLSFDTDNHNGASVDSQIIVQFQGGTFVPASADLQPAG